MALGRGLESLIRNNPIASQNENQLVELEIDMIRPNPDQPRKIFNQESLNELASSIENYGIIEPIIVKKEDESYIIIAGERRWRAAKQLGNKTIPAIIKDDKNNILELSIIENLQREDLNIVELAQGYDLLIKEYGYTQQELADKLGINRSSVTNILRILKLSDKVLDMLRDNELSYGKARALLSLETKKEQEEVAEEIKDKNLSVRQVEKLVNNRINPKPEREEEKEDIFVENINQWLSEKYDTNVKIKIKKDKGKVEFKFASMDQLNTLIKLLGYTDDII